MQPTALFAIDMESAKYGQELYRTLLKGNSFSKSIFSEINWNSMTSMEDFEHSDADSMFVDPGDDMYMDAEQILAQLSDSERETLMRQFQYYQQGDMMMPEDYSSEAAAAALSADENGAIFEAVPGMLNDEYGPFEDYDEYYDEYQEHYPMYPDDEFTRITFAELCDRCIFPTLSQAFSSLYALLGLCLLVRFTAYVTSEGTIIKRFIF